MISTIPPAFFVLDINKAVVPLTPKARKIPNQGAEMGQITLPNSPGLLDVFADRLGRVEVQADRAPLVTLLMELESRLAAVLVEVVTFSLQPVVKRIPVYRLRSLEILC